MGDQEELLARLRTGDAAAYEELVREHGGGMRAVARRLLEDETDADDAVQDAFLSAFRALGDFEGRAQLGTWLHRITINAALAKLRTKGRRNEVDIDALLPEFVDSGVFATRQVRSEGPADEPVVREELRQQVRDHIAKLPDNYRTPLILRDIEGWSHQEIAQALEISENAVKLRVHRARQALKTLLEPSVTEPA